MKKFGLVFILALAASFTSCKHDAEYHSSEYPATEQHWVQVLSASYPQWEAPAYVPANGAVNTQPAPAVEFLDSPVQEAPVAEPAVEVAPVETPATPPTDAALDAQPADSQDLIIEE